MEKIKSIKQKYKNAPNVTLDELFVNYQTELDNNLTSLAESDGVYLRSFAHCSKIEVYNKNITIYSNNIPNDMEVLYNRLEKMVKDLNQKYQDSTFTPNIIVDGNVMTACIYLVFDESN